MQLHTTVFERVLHLVLFLSAGIAFGLVALAVLERFAEGAKRTIRTAHLIAAVAAFGVLFVVERIYHWVR